MIADPVWYFYLFWIPEYLKRERSFSLADIGYYAWIPFVAADLGGLFAGFCSDRLIQRGMPAASARRRILYGAAVVAPVGILTSRAQSNGAAIALIASAGFICFVWFINTATLVSDVFPESVVGSVQGLIGSAGSAGAFSSI
jgi:ACS family hexuronate transporter-like MFS transporter